jgi:hypothetical protein
MIRSALILTALLTACATVTHPEPDEYRGFFTWGFEVNAFQPCGELLPAYM